MLSSTYRLLPPGPIVQPFGKSTDSSVQIEAWPPGATRQIEPLRSFQPPDSVK